MTWLIAKTFLGKALGWFAAHWMLVLFSLMAFSIWHYKSAYELSVQELATMKQAQTIASNKQIADFAVKKIAAQSTVDAAASAQAINMTRFNLDRTKSTDDIRTLYETQTSSIKHNLANRAGGMQPPAGNSGNPAEVASVTQEPARSEQECDSALAGAQSDYQTLEDACTITTSDFNVCRAVVDADTLIYERE